MNMNEPEDFLADPEAAALRVPPHSIEAEASVLGGLLLDNGAWERVGDLVTESDFYRSEHRLLFGTIAALVNSLKPADVITVFERLRDQGQADKAGGLVYINELAQHRLSTANMRRYAEIVREKALLRRMVELSDEIATSAFNPGDRTATDLLDHAQQVFVGLGDQGAPRDDWQDSNDGMVSLIDRIQAQADGEGQSNFVSTGLAELDELLNGGFREGHLIALGGRPSMGKTALAMSIGNTFAEAGHAVGMLSMEMPRTEVHERRMSMVSQIHLSRIQRGERLRDFDWPRLTGASERIRSTPFYTSDQTGLNINQVRAKARALKRRHGLRLLIVDYLGLMAGTDHKAPRAYQLDEITKGLKALAKELSITVLMLAQVGREVEKRPDQRPLMSDFRDSGSVEQDADVCMFVYRECRAKPGLPKEWDYIAELIVPKQRGGSAGKVEVMYVGENTLFKDWPEDQPKPESRVRVQGGGL
ncbi:replicative DNA helicase [Hydrogenophaga sp. 2FB]|uniref:replicative DNA helicase n=1 Tax=Hydrogenophaga sp. 2FB TaxID=2502187 RepID=UPI0010F8B4B7|nr:replicative DNA helicase [Hydrogenophaga sp. 2FB]